jgi:hypothetical protein
MTLVNVRKTMDENTGQPFTLILKELIEHIEETQKKII